MARHSDTARVIAISNSKNSIVFSLHTAAPSLAANLSASRSPARGIRSSTSTSKLHVQSTNQKSWPGCARRFGAIHSTNLQQRGCEREYRPRKIHQPANNVLVRTVARERAQHAQDALLYLARGFGWRRGDGHEQRQVGLEGSKECGRRRRERAEVALELLRCLVGASSPATAVCSASSGLGSAPPLLLLAGGGVRGASLNALVLFLVDELQQPLVDAAAGDGRCTTRRALTALASLLRRLQRHVDHAGNFLALSSVLVGILSTVDSPDAAGADGDSTSSLLTRQSRSASSCASFCWQSTDCSSTAYRDSSTTSCSTWRGFRRTSRGRAAVAAAAEGDPSPSDVVSDTAESDGGSKDESMETGVEALGGVPVARRRWRRVAAVSDPDQSGGSRLDGLRANRAQIAVVGRVAIAAVDRQHDCYVARPCGAD